MTNSSTKTGCSEAVLRELVHAGTLAPSGDNTQPWKFEIDPAESRITVSVDPTRDQSPMNAGQRMARIAVGAAVENILRTAKASGLTPVVTPPESDSITIQIQGFTDQDIEIPNEVRRRCTNRRFYDGSPISDSMMEKLKQTATSDDIQLSWIADREGIMRIAEIIRRADTMLFNNHALRNVFLDNVRFDRPFDEPVTEGLSLGSLEATKAEANALRLLTKLPNWMATALRVGPGIGKKSQKLVESSSGLCIGFADDKAGETDYNVGRAMQAAWLELTSHGFAVQPMMSIPVLDNAPRSNSSEVVITLSRELNTVCDAGYDKRPRFLLRFGTAALPSARTARKRVK